MRARIDVRDQHEPAQHEPLAGVQILRAVAALMVLVHHVAEESHALFTPGSYPARTVLVGVSSVDLFFVISGFIMLHTSYRQIGRPGATGRFVRRRLERIFPLYWVCLAIFAVAKAIGFYQSVAPTPYAVTASLLLLPSHALFISPAWTLVFELYFYALFALWMQARRPHALLVGLPLSAIAIAALAHALPPSGLRDYLSNPLAFDFLYGLGLAWLFRRGHVPRSPWLLGAIGAIGILASAALGPVTGANAADLPRTLRFLLFGVPAALVVYASLALPHATGRVARTLSKLGDASYALYLTHGFVMTAYARLLLDERIVRSLPLPVWMSLAVAFSIALGVATHHLVERPLARAVKKLGKLGLSRVNETPATAD